MGLQSWFQGLLCLLVGCHAFAFGASLSLGLEELPSYHSDGCGAQFRFTLEQAVMRSLDVSDRLDQVALAVESADLARFGAASEFRWKICPDGQAGVIGGGTAGQGPSVGGGLEISKCFVTGTKIVLRPNLTRANRKYTSDARARIEQPLLRGSSPSYNRRRIESAHYGWRTAIRNYYKAQVEVVLDTVRCVYDVLKRQYAVTLHEGILDRLEGAKEVARLKQSVGITDGADAHQVQMEMHRAKQKVDEARAALSKALEKLRDLLGLPIGASVAIHAPVTFDEEVPTVDQAIQIGLVNRIELEQAKDDLSEAVKNHRAQKHKALPSLNLVVDYTNCGTHQALVKSCTRDRIATWGVGLTSSAEIGPVTSRINLEQGRIGIRNAEISFRQKCKEIEKNVRQRVSELRRSQRKTVAEEAKVKAASGKVEVIELRFQHGMIPHLEVINALAQLQSAKSDWLDARVEEILSQYRLDAAMGLLAGAEACDQ